MLIDFSKAIADYGLSIKGVIHVGAHHGQEYDEYAKNNVHKVIFIEPCEKAFSVLRSKFEGCPDVTLFNVALGAQPGHGQMFVETANTGMSNSLLAPAKHLLQYPNIVFSSSETVSIARMDDLEYDRSAYNMICMDVQGYELEVLKGSTVSLKNIDYVYTEVNRDELYQGCARVEQLDAFLHEFDRVLTDWGGRTWGDALYIRKNIKKEPTAVASSCDVPAQFRPHIQLNYPEDNIKIFEEWFYEQPRPEDSRRTYLPIFWTSYYVNHRYGKDPGAIALLQQWLDQLDRGKKYYTIVQYDDGILNDLSKLDIQVYAMSKKLDYVLPLICKPHRFEFNSQRDIFANFIGRPTHPIRDNITGLHGRTGYYVSTGKHSLKDFCHILSRSVFTLCPRGYGATSFRIQEAMQYGSIPVYITDEVLEPHGIPFERYGILIQSEDAHRIAEILQSIKPEEIESKRKAVRRVYQEYFTFQANKELIVKNVNLA